MSQESINMMVICLFVLFIGLPLSLTLVGKVWEGFDMVKHDIKQKREIDKMCRGEK